MDENVHTCKRCVNTFIREGIIHEDVLGQTAGERTFRSSDARMPGLHWRDLYPSVHTERLAARRSGDFGSE